MKTYVFMAVRFHGHENVETYGHENVGFHEEIWIIAVLFGWNLCLIWGNGYRKSMIKYSVHISSVKKELCNSIRDVSSSY